MPRAPVFMKNEGTENENGLFSIFFQPSWFDAPAHRRIVIPKMKPIVTARIQIPQVQYEKFVLALNHLRISHYTRRWNRIVSFRPCCITQKSKRNGLISWYLSIYYLF